MSSNVDTNNLLSHLIAAYPLHNNAKDIVGENDGIIKGKILFKEDKHRKYCRPDVAAHDYIAIKEIESTALTISFWVKKEKSTDGFLPVIGHSYYDIDSDKYNWVIGIYDNKLAIGTQTLISEINADKWYHIVFVLTGEHYETYVNGKKVASGSYDNKLDKINQIGGFVDSNSNKIGCCNFSNILIFNKNLNEEEVEYIYKDVYFNNLQEQKQLIYEEELKHLAECSVANVRIERQENIEVKFDEEYNKNPLYVKPIALFDMNGTVKNVLNGVEIENNGNLSFQNQGKFKYLKKGSSVLSLGKINSNNFSLIMRIKDIDNGNLFTLKKEILGETKTVQARIDSVDDNNYVINIILPDNIIVKSIPFEKENGFQQISFVISAFQNSTFNIKIFVNEKTVLFLNSDFYDGIMDNASLYIGNDTLEDSLTFDIDYIYLFDKVLYKNQVSILNSNFIKKRPTNGLKDYSYAVLEKDGKILDEIYTLSDKKVTTGKSVPCFYIKSDKLLFNGNTFTKQNNQNVKNGFFYLKDSCFPCDDFYTKRDNSIILNQIKDAYSNMGFVLETDYLPYDYIVFFNYLTEEYIEVDYLKDIYNKEGTALNYESDSKNIYLKNTVYKAEYYKSYDKDSVLNHKQFLFQIDGDDLYFGLSYTRVNHTTVYIGKIENSLLGNDFIIKAHKMNKEAL